MTVDLERLRTLAAHRAKFLGFGTAPEDMEEWQAAKEIADLREALRPLAKAMDWFERRMGNEMQFIDEDSHMIGCEITVAHLRRARAKLEGGSDD